MQVQLLPAENIKTLQHYAVALMVGMYTLKSQEEYHRYADNLGLLDDTESTQARLMIGRFRELIKLYQKQLEACLERIPEEIDAKAIIAELQKNVTKKKKKPIKEE